jgi:hypothetical protein
MPFLALCFKKMQDIEDVIEGLPAEEQILIRRLRSLILEKDTRIRERLSYGVPYFFRNRRLFFLWPASATPGASAKPLPTVTLGFCYGNLLSDSRKILVRENRKQVYTIPFMSASEIDDRLLSEILIEAIMIDDEFFRKRK